MTTYHRVTVRCDSCGEFSPATGLGVGNSGEMKLETKCERCLSPATCETTADELVEAFRDIVVPDPTLPVDLKTWDNPGGIVH